MAIPEFDTRDLVLRSKEGRVSDGELDAIASYLSAGSGGSDTYNLLYVIGRSSAVSFESLVAGYLEYPEDPMVARLALQILCSFWGLAEKYRKVMFKFLKGVDWDFLGDVREVAISAAGEFLSDHRDPELLGLLLRLGDRSNVDALERRFSVEAVARAMGVDYADAVGPKGGSAAWEQWADKIMERGRERFNSEYL